MELADSGSMKKTGVVPEFNWILEPKMCYLKTLSQVKKRLDSGGDAYIEFKHK